MNETSRLLVVDDEELNRDVLSRRLRRAGYAVEVAESGPAALKVLEQQKIELILLDNMMPGMTGIDLLKLLRATHSPAALPVIMVTALAESERIVQALTMGANDYVTKPVDFPRGPGSHPRSTATERSRGRAARERGALRAGCARRQRRHLGLRPAHRPSLLLAPLETAAGLPGQRHRQPAAAVVEAGPTRTTQPLSFRAWMGAGSRTAPSNS